MTEAKWIGGRSRFSPAGPTQYGHRTTAVVFHAMHLESFAEMPQPEVQVVIVDAGYCLDAPGIELHGSTVRSGVLDGSLAWDSPSFGFRA